VEPVYTFTPQEIEDGKALAGVSYIGVIGLLIAFIMGKDNRFVLYHVQQSLVLVIASIPCFIPIIGWIWAIFILVALIMGLMNGFGGKAVPVPLIGSFGFKFGILKPDFSSPAAPAAPVAPVTPVTPEEPVVVTPPADPVPPRTPPPADPVPPQTPPPADPPE
jgi:uncharacterized membrane protein